MESEKSFYAYTHSRPDGSVFYVGKGFARRAWWFKQGRNPYHRSIIEKHGAENIIVTIYPCVDENAAFELEKVLVTKFRAEGNRLANMTDGGEGPTGRPMSDKARAALAAYRATGVPKTEAQRQACSENMKRSWENNPAMRENAARMAEARKGVKRPPNVVEALVTANKGKKQTGERLEKTLKSQQLAQEAAKLWHSSEEGKNWHAQHGKETWINREWVEVACKECSRPFRTPYPTKAKWCCRGCQSANARRKQGRPVGVRPHRRKTPVLSGKRVVGE